MVKMIYLLKILIVYEDLYNLQELLLYDNLLLDIYSNK